MYKILILLFVLIFCSCGNKIFTKAEAQQIPLTSYKEALQTETHYYLIDVRTPKEYKKGHFKNAINISLIGFKFKKKIKKLDTNKTVFIYCETAHRSPYAAKRLRKLGFKKIIDLEKGYKMHRKNSD